MKALSIVMTLLWLSGTAWSAETPTVLGIGPKSTFQEAQQILRARGGKLSFPYPEHDGQELQELQFEHPGANGLIIILSFSQDVVRYIEGGDYSEGASEGPCLEQFERAEKFFDLPKDLRRYRYEHRPEPSVIRKGVIHCLPEGGVLDNSVDFMVEGGVCAVNFTARFAESCEAALERRLGFSKIPREHVTEE